MNVGLRNNQQVLAGGEVIFYLNEFGGVVAARVTIEEIRVPPCLAYAILKAISPHTITAIGIVGSVGARHGLAHD